MPAEKLGSRWPPFTFVHLEAELISERNAQFLKGPSNSGGGGFVIEERNGSHTVATMENV